MLIACVLALGLSAQGATASGGSRGHDEHGRWHPRATTEPWQWQLQGPIDTSVVAAVYDVDGFETSKRTVRKLHRQGRKVVC